MRFIVLVKANDESEGGALPKPEDLEAMTQYNEELLKAGVLLAGEGLHPSSKGVRIAYSGGKTTVTDGPFTEAKELVAGFWIIQAKDLEEAVEWLKRAPLDGGEVEIRQVFETDEFNEVMSPELREREKKIFEQARANAER
jgi:hypothetical protein